MKKCIMSRSGLVFLILLVFALAPALPAADKKPKPAKNLVSEDDLFAQTNILRLQIDMSADAAEALKKDPKTYVKATVREGTQTFHDVAVRLKGNGSFQSLDKKPSLALKFNEFVPAQKFHSHSKIFLNNSGQDKSYLCETISGQIFRDAGIPAARTAFARIDLNGRDAGLYVLAEAINKEFLARNFKKSKGNLYEGSNNDVSDTLDQDSGGESTDQKDLKDLARAAQIPDAAQRWDKLAPLLDIDRFITFAAVETFVWHHDGYTMDRNNYRIYHDPTSGRLVFLPHGLDLLFGKANAPLWPEWKGLVALAVLDSPEGKKRYAERVAKLLSSVAPAATLQARAQEWAARIRPALIEAEIKPFNDAVARLREGFAQRAKFLEAELNKPPQQARR